MAKLSALCAGLVAGLMAAAAHAQTWTLDGEASHLAFGSVKKEEIGEVHSFGGLKGTVDAEGKAEITIDLSSVETNIDIRNERMIEHVFKNVGEAQLTATIDMEEVAGLAVGETAVVDAIGVLTLVGVSLELDAEMFVARLAEDRVMVSTNDMIFLSTEEAGITAGIDKLMELANLPGITRAAPVTLRFIFTQDVKKAEAAPAAPAPQLAAIVGDVKKGKKVFKKCKACHQLKAGKHKVGPSLAGILGQPAGAQEGFRYSKAMADSGLTWDVDTMTAFLTKPKDVLKKTSMAFRGLKKPEDIENLLAYLADN
ncbi:MAG: c-type cytochrome [Pseudomonadota bacterium]